MKKQILVLSFILTSLISNAQVLCIQCYLQNAPVSTNITNLVLNGGLETHNCIPQNWFSSSYCPNSNYYNCDIANWTCTGGGTATYADIVTNQYTVVPEGTYACYFGTSFGRPCSMDPSDTSCLVSQGCTFTGFPAGYPQNDVQYGGTTGVVLSQTVNGLTPGNTYVLEFWAGGESFPQEGVFAVDLGFGNMYIKNPPTPNPQGVGRRVIIQFIATAASHTLKFINWGHLNSNWTELILDDVRVYPISQLSSIIPACAVGISDPQANMISIAWKNNSHVLEVSSEIQSGLTLKVYDVLSQNVYETSFYSSYSATLESLPAGVYIYAVMRGSDCIGKGKFISQN
jgi:hypothetical protein